MRAQAVSLVLLVGSLALAAKPGDEVAGFGEARWGMSKDEVLAAEKGAIRLGAGTPSEMIVRNGEVAGAMALIGYTFEEGALVEVVVEYTRDRATTSRYTALKRVLTQKYGRGSGVKARLGTRLGSYWERARTTVLLTFDKNELFPENQVIHIIYRDASKPLPRNDVPDETWSKDL